ncbi:MAG: right-handed parallel beta-helix repeat-containing protein [Candidatus Lokiarchaeota archaeon]|nr:right-handed parallel beta-helix repeat-containing protein [Candidatus Lokiarchaeota archaeon]
MLLIVMIGLGSWGAISLVSALIGEGAREPSVNGLVEITHTVHVDGNWSAVRSTYPWCSGAGTAGDPYVIENLYMNCHGTRTGIIIEQTSEHFVVRNCTVFNAEGNGSGIWLQFTDNGELSGNTIVDNQGGGIYLYYDCNNITVIGNSVDRNGKNGIYISAGSDNRVSGNAVHRNVGRGIWLMKADGNEVIGNSLKDNWAGIGITNSNSSTVSSNFLSLNNEGISLLNSRDNVITQNTIQFNVQGIVLRSSSGNMVTDSDFVLNLVLKTEEGQSSGNVFSGNHEESPLVGYTGAAVFLTAFVVLGIATIRYWKKKP